MLKPVLKAAQRSALAKNKTNFSANSVKTDFVAAAEPDKIVAEFVVLEAPEIPKV